MLFGKPFGVYEAKSGTRYTASATGEIDNVSANDTIDLMRAGCSQVSGPGVVGVAATNVTAQELGDARTHTTVLTLGPAAVLPAIAGGAALALGVLLYTLPAGAQVIEACHTNVAIQDSGGGHITANTPVVGVGTTIASGAVAVLSGTAAFQNINAGVAAADCNGTPTVDTSVATASPFQLVTEVGGAKNIYLNVAATWSASGDPGALLSGTITIRWNTMA
jgi:hypothetical protein